MNEEPVGPGPLTLEIIPDRAYYLQGQEIHFSIYVSNTHDWRVPKPTTIIYDIVNFSSQTVMIDYVNPHPCFEPHSRNLFVTYKWDQKTEDLSNQNLVPPGNYTFTVSFEGPVNYDSLAAYSFEIRPNL